MFHFEVQADEFVQILHNGHEHWLTFGTTGLIHGEQPGRFLIDQDKMRQHLLKCLQEGEMMPFPLKKIRRNASQVRKAGIP